MIRFDRFTVKAHEAVQRAQQLAQSQQFSARQKTAPPRGPRRVLCVVVGTKSACGNGLE